MSRAVVAAVVAAIPILTSGIAWANGGVLTGASESAVTQLDISSAVAVTPFGTTRWARITFSGTTKAMWLVPARPGALADWSSSTWLDALDDASAPRIVPPSPDPPCGLPATAERVATFGSIGVQRTSSGATILASEGEARAHAQSRGFAIDANQSVQLGKVFASGFVLLAFEIESPTMLSSATTPTLRVSDDGPAALPLALTGSANARTRITAFVTSPNGHGIGGATEVQRGSITWGPAKSSYAPWRTSTLTSGAGSTWIRESADTVMIDAAMGGPASPTVVTPSVIERYFATPACLTAARSAAAKTGVVAKICPAGVVAKVPGAACTPQSGDLDAAPFVCGADDDLALALAGSTPNLVVLSRFAGIVMEGTLGADIPLVPLRSNAPAAVPAGAFEECRGAPPSSSPPVSSPPSDSTPPPDPGVTYVTADGACGGSTTTTVDDDDGSSDDSGGCGGSTSGTSTSNGDSDGQGCSGDSKKSSDDSDSSDDEDDSDGWDKQDDDSKSSDSCGGKSDSSASPKTEKSTAALGKKKKRGSPVSRFALLAVAIVLPIRRRLRFAADKRRDRE